MYYLKRSNTGITVKDGSKEYLINSGLKNYINKICMENLSTYEGRRLATANLLNEKDNIPIYINSNIFLFPTKSLRNYDTLFINFFSILSIRKIDKDSTLVTFDNLDELVVDVNLKKMIKQCNRIEKISEIYLKVN